MKTNKQKRKVALFYISIIDNNIYIKTTNKSIFINNEQFRYLGLRDPINILDKKGEKEFHDHKIIFGKKKESGTHAPNINNVM